MILLDTHVWVWWVQNDPRMKSTTAVLDAMPPTEISVSAISCWEVSALHARGRIGFDCSLDEWLEAALHDAAVSVVNLTAEMAVAAERLPGDLHGDPADRMLIATARSLNCGLLTEDQKILDYKHVDAFGLNDLASRASRS